MFKWIIQRYLYGEQSKMSTCLAPRLRDDLKGKVTLYVPENSVLSLSTPRQKLWREYLVSVIKDGGDIRYIFTDAYEADKASLRPLKAELESHGAGTIRFCYFTPAVITDGEDKRHHQSLRTFHPVLAEDEHGIRMMWIEEHHPRGNDTLAFSVEFVGKEDAAKDVRFDQYRTILDSIIERYGME